MNQSAREAMIRIALDEVDAILKRLEEERAAWPALLESTRAKLVEDAKKDALDDLAKRTREHWQSVGVVASKAATNAAVAAIAASLKSNTTLPLMKIIAASAAGGAAGAALTVLVIRLVIGS